MKKKFLSFTFAILFAFMAIGAGVVATTYFSNSSVEVVEAALTTSQTKTIQTKLKRWGYYTGSVDGVYGPKTKEAVKLFQRKNGLAVDGIVGKKTAAALGISLSTSSTTNSISNADLNLLAKCVYAEARGESYVGQVAVASVILNRVKSPKFPNTISGVIYQPYAFTCVNDGQINLTPNQTAFNAAQDAMNGWDPTYGAIYYYNPKTATSSWIRSRTTTITIGKHVFAV